MLSLISYIDVDEYPEIYFEEIEAPNVQLEFYLTLKIQWVEGLNAYRYGGDAFNDSAKDPAKADTPPLIEVRLEIDPEQYPQVLEHFPHLLSIISLLTRSISVAQNKSVMLEPDG
jgi:hypothetical protein